MDLIAAPIRSFEKLLGVSLVPSVSFLSLRISIGNSNKRPPAA